MKKKIPFDIKYRKEIESGKYSVETVDGRHVSIVCFDSPNPTYPIYGFIEGMILIFNWNSNGRHYNKKDETDLIIIIGEVFDEKEYQEDIRKTLIRMEKRAEELPGIKDDEWVAIRHAINVLTPTKEPIEETYEEKFRKLLNRYSDEEFKEILEKVGNMGIPVGKKHKEIISLPKWTRTKPNKKYIHNKGWYLTWEDLEKLPKEGM